jgi:hypothetical protein
MFRTQYIPDFVVAEHYGLRNTSSWGSKDLASEEIERCRVRICLFLISEDCVSLCCAAGALSDHKYQMFKG